MSEASERLRHILESDTTKDEEKTIDEKNKTKNGMICENENGEEEVEEKIEKFDKITDKNLAVLKQLPQNLLLKILDRTSNGGNLDEVIQVVAKELCQQIKKAEEDQYKTINDINSLSSSLISVATNNHLSDLEKDIISSLKTSDAEHRPEYFLHVARFVPLRLTYEERRFLRLLESALEVSEYTDKIDILCGGNKARRIARELRQICAILSGLVIAHNYEDGQRLVRDREYYENADFFRTIFEIGRRYKILNPERMRSSYGKLIYLLMDSRKQDVYDLLQFDFVDHVNTVYKLLENRKNGLEMLKDPLVKVATMEIVAEGKNRSEVQKEIQTKEDAIKILCKKYATKKSPKKSHGLFGLKFAFFSSSNYNGHVSSSDDEEDNVNSGSNNECGLSYEEIEQALHSIGDHNTYLRFNRDPCDQMIKYLKKYFRPEEYEEGFCLSITAGKAGARLSHNHSRQYMYALQSLTLWREISHEMFTLWHLAEADLLDCKNIYRLRDTGQGFHRVQDSPRVSNAMHSIINRVQQRVGGWIGSSVVHLGDHNVPNALMFIDKYTQVPRILSPLVLCLQKIDEVCESKPALKQYVISQFGGVIAAKKKILCDFYRHAFDGSGADNFYDAGSCIDGRLTSAWNWCSNIEKKSYFPLFLLTGFTGFDGRF